MPYPLPAPVNPTSGLLLTPPLLVGCGPNNVLVPAMQYGMNGGDLALSNLFEATDDDQPIDPVNAVTGIAKGAAGQAGSLGAAGVAAGS